MNLSKYSALFLAASLATLAANKGRAEEPLVYFTWAGYDDPSFRKPFTEKYGQDGVQFAFYSSPDEAFAKMKGGFKADIAHACVHDIQKWKNAGLIQPIDTSKIENWKDLIPALRDAPAIQFEGKQWMIPWEWGASSVLYRSDKVTDLKEESYAIMIDPAYKGRTAIIDAFDETYQLAAILAHIKNPLKLEEADYPLVEDMMRKLRDNSRMIWSDPTQLQQALASGEVDVAWGWPNTYASLQKQNVPVKFMLNPKEGLVTWECGYTLPTASGTSRQIAYDFINALEAPESGQALITNFGYGHSNSKSLSLVPKSELELLGLAGDPGKTIEGGNLMGPMPEDQRDRLIQMWTLIKAGG